MILSGHNHIFEEDWLFVGRRCTATCVFTDTRAACLLQRVRYDVMEIVIDQLEDY